MVDLDGEGVPFGADLLFAARNVAGCVVGVEICEDLWAVNPLSGNMALAGATVLLNPSASDEVLGKSEYRRDLVKQQSARCLAAYLYAGAGPGESTTDVVVAGHSLIAENGIVLAETERFHFASQMAATDVDEQRLIHERVTNSSFASALPGVAYRTIPFDVPEPAAAQLPLLRPDLSTTPFVPAGRRTAGRSSPFNRPGLASGSNTRGRECAGTRAHANPDGPRQPAGGLGRGNR